MNSNIKIFIMDVDGTLTDGKIYMGETGEMMKTFNVKDGLGIAKLHSVGIVPVIITGRDSEILIKRSEELKIIDLYQGIENKVKKLKEVIQRYKCDYSNIAYIGDDENDIECIKLCGITGCPSDAVDVIKNAVDFISNYRGGNGAVRDFIEWIMKEK